ncbi:bifunctional RNase H/acid phosphatase [Lentzea sp. BCCO 10_0798]|uniref:Bifunctional RNase H/acid phosphatase n=1 Tax=Lentzea kristufekii TaxID=3095430 RepID=A0ABU4U576_9PSEU|nr:bifunctional RNase H/acid phosphatase [Lentzea sp. BCCO 10_0798]MDX8055607.1 bifunctional RNase H/acid phosphatase [Lentzea sp. BCCO 10_0798]
MIVEADGGSRGNPGPAGYGAVVRDKLSGETLAERKGFIGVATNNVAEYQGLIAGLRAARELNAETVDVRMDSKLVVEQMSGRWKIKHPSMQPLAREAQEVARDFQKITYEWIPRERNRQADRLANEAMDDEAKPQANQEPQEAEGAKQPHWSGAAGEPTRLILLRHGQTKLSVDRRYSGRGDHPLTDLGLEQAEKAAARLSKMDGIAGVISSPLQRAQQTARKLADKIGLEVVTHQGLIETDFGAWEGLTFAEASKQDPEVHRRWLGDTSVKPPNGESFDEVHARVRKARTDIIARYGGKTLVLVSHVTPIKTLLRQALDVGPQFLFRMHLDLTGVSIAEFYPDGHASVKLVNDTSHLG